ncbi:MAG: hypothetical protein ACKODX_17170 [Gemmata sp.]
MTEAEWVNETHPGSIALTLCRQLGASRAAKGQRKLRLYACACSRRARHLFTSELSGKAVETAEQYAEGAISQDALERECVRGMQHGALCCHVCDGIGAAVVHAPYAAVEAVAWASNGKTPGSYYLVRDAERSAQIAILRDIFGNPFRPVTFAPSWRADTARALAAQMYESRDFSAMPVLADALRDAGCDSDDILSHCRGEGPHVRGCWVVDLVLGKE